MYGSGVHRERERVRKSWLPNHGHGKRMYGSGVHRERERELGRAGFRIMVMVNACMAVGYIEREREGELGRAGFRIMVMVNVCMAVG